MVSKNLLVSVVALIVGLAVGYVLSLPAQMALQARVDELQSKLNPSFVEKIKARGVLVMGTSADWPPFEYIDKNGNVVGIDVEIGKRIARELGVKLEVRDLKFAALIEALKSGQVDIVIADMTPTAERGLQVDFSIPYYFSKGNAVVVPKNKLGSFSQVKDLYGKKIGVQLGTIQEEWAKSALSGHSEIISYDRVYPEMIMALQRGDIDAIIIGDIMASVIVGKEPTLEVAFYAGGSRIGASVAVPLGATDLKYVVNKVIEQLLESGEMENIMKTEVAKWLEGSG